MMMMALMKHQRLIILYISFLSVTNLRCDAINSFGASYGQVNIRGGNLFNRKNKPTETTSTTTPTTTTTTTPILDISSTSNDNSSDDSEGGGGFVLNVSGQQTEKEDEDSSNKGFFTELRNRFRTKRDKIDEQAHKTAEEIEKAIEQQREDNKKRAEIEVRVLEEEARRLAAEAQRVAESTANVMEQYAISKAEQYETAARQRYATIAAKVEEVAKRKLASIEQQIENKINEIEKASNRKIDYWEYGFVRMIDPDGARRKDLEDFVIRPLTILLTVWITMTGLSNILGVPQTVVDHWEKTNFGTKFIPIDAISISNKRILSGLMEISSAVLMIQESLRKYGLATVGLMYTQCILITDISSSSIWEILPFVFGVAISVFLLYFQFN